jgi:hypothetical protein
MRRRETSDALVERGSLDAAAIVEILGPLPEVSADLAERERTRELVEALGAARSPAEQSKALESWPRSG